MIETQNNIHVLKALSRQAANQIESLSALHSSLQNLDYESPNLVEIMDKYQAAYQHLVKTLQQADYLVKKHAQDLQQQEESRNLSDHEKVLTAGLTFSTVAQMLQEGSKSFIEMQALMLYAAVAELDKINKD